MVARGLTNFHPGTQRWNTVLRELSKLFEKILPFENFSPDKENAFFADGIQDDILTSLAQIG